MIRQAWENRRVSLATGLRFGAGALFLYTGAAKANYPFDLLANIREYGLLNDSAAVLVALSLPWLEMVTGVCLLTGMASGSAFLVAMMLSCMFVVAQTSVLWRGLVIACGCFGSDDTPIDTWTLARTGSLLAASIWGFWLTVGTPRRTRACNGANRPRATSPVTAGPERDGSDKLSMEPT